MFNIIEFISNLILKIIETGGYAGIYFLMFLQSCNIPIPSEITMPFSGFLAGQKIFNFWLVVLVGVLGSLTGAFLSYKFASALIKNGWREKSKVLQFLLSENNLKTAENFFQKYGAVSVFLGRMIPVISTFVSFPAGLAKMRTKTFLALTLAGSLIWCFILTKIGFILGENWMVLGGYFRKFDYVILALILIGLAIWFYRHFKEKKKIRH